jgi:hypothetical protein
MPPGEMQIDRRFLKVAMPEQHLDGAQIGAGFEQKPSLPLCRAAKSPCMRNMQRILQHTRLIRRIASALESGKTVPFHIPPNGERLAIVN